MNVIYPKLGIDSVVSLKDHANSLATRTSRAKNKLTGPKEILLEVTQERLAGEASFHRFDFGNAV
jgi:hypothetical protein